MVKTGKEITGFTFTNSQNIGLNETMMAYDHKVNNFAQKILQ